MKPFVYALVATACFSLAALNQPASAALSRSTVQNDVEKSSVSVEPLASAQGESSADFAAKKTARLDELEAQGRKLYDAGDLPGAHGAFAEMLQIDPGNAHATTYLDNMKDEWNRYLEQKHQHEEKMTEEQKGQEMLATPVTIETLRSTPLDEFLNNLSFASGINFTIASGVQASVNNVKYIDTPVQEVLDTVLLPIGLKWQREDSVIVVEPALESRTFHFSKDDMPKLKTLYDSQSLQHILWGPDAQPSLQGEAMVLDERDQALVASDSQQRLDKLASLLNNLNQTIAPELVTRLYKIQPDAGPKIRAVLDAIMQTGTPTPFDTDRRVYVDGEDLIIRETPEGLVKDEQVLQDEGYLEKLVTDKLDIQSFSLIPRDALTENPEYLQSFASRVVEQVRTYLYTKSGVAEAQAEGRRMWFDPNTMTMTISDYPENLTEVGGFLDSLPELKSEERFKVIFVKYILDSDMQTQLDTILGLQAPATAGGAGALTITKSLNRTDQFTWRDLTVTVKQVIAGNPNDKYSDSAVIIANVAGSRESTSLTLNELDVAQFVTDAQGGEYELSAADIEPSGRPGEGRVRLTIVYVPPTQALTAP